LAEVKIAYVGGGSVGWAHNLMKDLALTPELTGELALYDINRTAAEHNKRRGAAIFSHREAVTHFRVTVAARPADALRGADFVVMSILPGPMWMFANDLDIPARYGIVQPVGDTTGPGGISRALRSIPIYADYARQIMRYCPSAWVINYTNPMTLCTAALYAAEPRIKAFGCCHEVFGTQGLLRRLVNEKWGANVQNRSEIKVGVTGVNHFTFVPTATWDGRDLYPLVEEVTRTKDFFRDRTADAAELKAAGKVFSSAGDLVKYDFYRRFGVLGAAGDRHLVEFVPWYARSEAELMRWGVILTPSSYRLSSRPVIRRGAPLPRGALKFAHLGKSGEEGVGQMLAVLGLRDLDTNVNLPNRGQIAALPAGAVVETNAQFRRDSVLPVTAPPLPAGLLEAVRRLVAVQEMTLKAGMERDPGMAMQAVLNDPLVTIPTDKACRMFRELLRANRAALPGWKVLSRCGRPRAVPSTPGCCRGSKA
jgi:alpha-galactosidase